MTGNKIKIHCFDDQEDAANWMKIAICPYHNEDEDFRKEWTENNIEWKWFESVGSAISYYEETKEFPDILSIDIDSSELRIDYDLTKELSNYQISLIPSNFVGDERSIVRGRSLMEYANQKFPNCKSFFITGQANKKQVYNEATNAVLKGIVSIHKGGGYKDIQEEIIFELKQLIQKYIYKLDSYSKIGLKNKLCELNKEDFLDLKVNIDCKEYHLKDILIAYLPLEENEFRIEINKLFIPDLSLAASECFGILGIKQITHVATDYYFKDARLFQKIKNQIDLMNKNIDEISNESVTEKLSSFRNYIKEFTIEFQSNNNQIYNHNLRLKRNDYFQYKGDCFNGILGEMNKDSGNSDNFFELNIPIQNIFEQEFGLFKESILEKSAKGAGANIYNWFNLATKESAENVEGYEINLWNNFIGFYHDGNNSFNPEDLNHYQANWLKSFQKSLNYFGKLYILRKEGDDEYNVFDCTSDSVIKTGKYCEWKCVLKKNSQMKRIMSLQKNNYFIFSFLTKKPEN